MLSAVIVRLRKHVSKCTEGREEESWGAEKHMCRFRSGFRRERPPEWCDQRSYRITGQVPCQLKIGCMSVVVLLDVVCYLSFRFIIALKTNSRRGKWTALGSFSEISLLGRCNQRGSLWLYCSSWLCAQGPSRLTLH